MNRWIIGSSLSSRLVVVVLGAALMVIGVSQLRHAPVDVLPEFSPPTVEVQTEALGLSAAEVEQLITVPLEQDLLSGVAWLETIRSESIPGLSRIEMTFEPGTDLYRARQVVQERLSQAAGLPNVSAPPQMIPPRSSIGRVMMIRLSSSRLSPIQLSVLARWTIRPRLLGVPGVANVSIWGQRERQLQVQVDPDRLREQEVSLQQVIETTGNALWASPLSFLEASTPGTGGFIDLANQRLAIQHLQPIAAAADLARVPIEDSHGAVVRLGDVASVVEDHQPLIGDAVFADGAGLLVVVEKFPEANTLAVTRGVDAALDSLRPGLTGVKIDPTIYRPATYLEASARNVGRSLLIGLLLLVLVLVLLLFEWRSALIIVVTILLSLTAAGLVLSLRGATINAMVVAGLATALGAVIGTSVDDVEHVVARLRRRRMNGRDEPVSRVVLEAALEMRGAAAYATFIILLTATPVLFLTGTPGAFLPPLVLSYLLAVVASMAVALLVTPALCLILLSTVPFERRGSALARWLQGAYGRALSRILPAPLAVYGAVGAIVVASLAVLPFLQHDTVPSFTDRAVLIRWTAAPGTSLPEMDRITARAARELRSLPGVRDVGASVGRALMSDQVSAVDSGELWASIDPAADYGRTRASVEEVAHGYPGIRGEVLTYPGERIADILGGTDPPVVVRIYGHDLDVLRSKAEEVRRAISGIDGVVDARVESQFEQPTVEVEVDLAAARRSGIKPGDVRRAASTLLSGTVVGSLFEQQKVFDVVVWGAPDVRGSVTSVRDLLIDTPQGGHVRLGAVADVHVGPFPTVIRHVDVSRSIDVRAGVRGRDVGTVIADVQRRIQGIEFPVEHHAELVGNYAERQADHGRVLAVLVASAIGVFLFLQAALGSWRLAAASFVLALLAPAGAVLAVSITGRLVSLGSIAGFIAVFGIAARTGITSIRSYQLLGEGDGGVVGPDTVLRGARERLVPIVMTAVGTALALLPFVVFGAAAGQEIPHPMSIAILGGLVTSTLLNLFVAPALYLRIRSSTATEPSRSEVLAVPESEPVLD